MANLRIDNLSGDTITVCFCGKEYTVADEEKVTVDAVEKGVHEMRVHRTRVPMETADSHEAGQLDIKEKAEKSERSLHTQLDAVFDVNINASKTVVTVRTKVRAKEKVGIDVIFSGYSIETSGGKVENFGLVFANKNVRKNFMNNQIKEALLPVGLGGIILFIMGIFALRGNITGNPINLGGRIFTLPWSIVLAAVGLGFIGYSLYVIIYSMKIAKHFDEK